MRECRNPDCNVSLKGASPRKVWCSERCRRTKYGGPRVGPPGFLLSLEGPNTPEANRKRVAALRAGIGR